MFVAICRGASGRASDSLCVRPMRRIALILLLFIALSSAPHFGVETLLQPTPAVVTADALPMPSESVQRAAYGPLKLRGLWRLRSDAGVFGGISSLLAYGDGRFTGLSDSGEYVNFVLGSASPGLIASLPRLPEQLKERHRLQDTESMTRDPASGRIWAGFEQVQRICRYAPGFARIERCAYPPAMKDWPKDFGAESLVRLGDGRFLTIGERAFVGDGGHEVLLWAGDPTEPGTPPPMHLSYRAPTGFMPTDAVWLGGDKLLVLTRRMTVADWFTAKLTLVHLPKLEEGAVLQGQVIASFEPPGPADNMEALAITRDGDGPMLWVASDDNHLALQRTLLFKFALPRDWVSDKPAP